QYASSLGKTANCQTMVSLTLARGEVPVMVALRLFIPESWTSNPKRLKRAGVPVEHCVARTKPEIALAEIDRVIAAGVRFGLRAGGCRIRAQRAVSSRSHGPWPSLGSRLPWASESLSGGGEAHLSDRRSGATGSISILKGTSNNCHRSSGAPNLPTNDSALFSF